MMEHTEHDTRPHHHMTCKWCRWQTRRICFAGDRPDSDMKAEFAEHIATAHRRDHPVRAFIAEMACRLYAKATMR